MSLWDDEIQQLRQVRRDYRMKKIVGKEVMMELAIHGHIKSTGRMIQQGIALGERLKNGMSQLYKARLMSPNGTIPSDEMSGKSGVVYCHWQEKKIPIEECLDLSGAHTSADDECTGCSSDWR